MTINTLERGIRGHRLALLHYASLPTIGGVEFCIASHARLLAALGHEVTIVTGRGEQFDSRIPVHTIPLIDSKDSRVLRVNQQLSRGIVTEEFYLLASSIRIALQDELSKVDVCVAHNILTLHKNLALSYALHEIALTQSVNMIGWCHDLA